MGRKEAKYKADNAAHDKNWTKTKWSTSKEWSASKEWSTKEWKKKTDSSDEKDKDEERKWVKTKDPIEKPKVVLASKPYAWQKQPHPSNHRTEDDVPAAAQVFEGDEIEYEHRSGRHGSHLGSSYHHNEPDSPEEGHVDVSLLR